MGAEEASAGADLVVEAILEDLQVKRDLFARIDSAAPPSTILASNTSSLAIGHIAEATKRPERFVGLHFFNPVPMMKLLEVVRTDQSNSDVVQAVSDWGASLGKTVVPCKDTPGFIVNRLLVPFLFEAVRMVERGDAKPEDVDVAMKLEQATPWDPLNFLTTSAMTLWTSSCRDGVVGIQRRPCLHEALQCRGWSARANWGRRLEKAFTNTKTFVELTSVFILQLLHFSKDPVYSSLLSLTH